VNPFEGYQVSSPYGPRTNPFDHNFMEFHKGIDLVKAHRSPILTFVSGEVLHAKLGVAGSGLGGYGIAVAVRDKNNYLHIYAHLDSTTVKVGQQVTAGQEIGKQGTTGQSTGSHLHYEVRQACTPNFGYGTHVDPTNYLISFISKEEKMMLDELQSRINKLESRLTKLESQASIPVPDWARDAVDKAVQTSVLMEPNGASFDLYRVLTILNRKGLL